MKITDINKIDDKKGSKMRFGIRSAMLMALLNRETD